MKGINHADLDDFPGYKEKIAKSGGKELNGFVQTIKSKR